MDRNREPLTKGSFGVLIVDDELAITQVMKAVLKHAGYDCTTASSAKDALAVLQSATCHLVVTDIRMPGMSGVELADVLAQDHPNVAVAFMTGYAEYNALADAIKLRPIGFLEKPFLPDLMVALVDKAFAQYQDAEQERQENLGLEQVVADKSRDLEFRTGRLLAEQELLRGIISNANFGLVAIDSSGLTHLLNPLAVQLLSIEPSAAGAYHGLPLHQLLPETMHEPLDSLLLASSQSEGLQHAEFTNSIIDRRLHIIVNQIRHRDTVAAIVFIIHDITELDMLQKRLLQSAKLASIGELAAGVAHEINNPLGFVISNCTTLAKYAETIRSYVLALEQIATCQSKPENALAEVHSLKKTMDTDYILGDLSQLLTETQDGLGHVAKIVRDLKTFAHPDSDSEQVCDINSLLDDALNLVRNETKYCLTITKKYEEVQKISCLPSQLVQVFTNMFVNAAHAVKGKGNLIISTTKDEQFARISIQDDGAGIPEKHLQKIFDPFFTTKPPGKGTGMGLSISYGIVKRHGGNIHVKSVEGSGTEFIIELPLKVSQGSLQEHDCAKE